MKKSFELNWIKNLQVLLMLETKAPLTKQLSTTSIPCVRKTLIVTVWPRVRNDGKS